MHVHDSAIIQLYLCHFVLLWAFFMFFSENVMFNKYRFTEITCVICNFYTKLPPAPMTEWGDGGRHSFFLSRDPA